MSFTQPSRLCRKINSIASSTLKHPLHQTSSRQYARLTLIGNLVQDAKVIERGTDKEPMIALKIATTDTIGREAREAGKEPTSSFHDVLSFNSGLNKYLSEFRKGSLVHVEADVKMQPREQVEAQPYQPPVVRLTLREVHKLRNPRID